MIPFLIIWAIIGMIVIVVLVLDGCMPDSKNWKQTMFLMFIFGPAVWIICLVISIFAGLVWFYELLGKEKKS